MGVTRSVTGFRRLGPRQRVVVVLTSGALAVLPASYLSESAGDWTRAAAADYSGDVELEGGTPPDPNALSVDGSLPGQANPEDLRVYEAPPTGPLGIPSTALKAYRNAARMVGAEYPGCHIDWALLASIGRIESNHARGGYVDTSGNTLEPILGPVLNGVGNVAAISDTDEGRYDGDTVWDRAVGPTQFIPGTWARYGADGNRDGERDPNNIFDATVATARYLCSGGLDLAKEDQLRAAVYRYNNSDSYVETVIRWARAYRGGVDALPDSKVPLAVPRANTVEAPSPVAPPDASATTGSRQRTDGSTTTPTPELPAQTSKPSSSPRPTGGTTTSTTTTTTTTSTTTTTTTSPTSTTDKPCESPTSTPSETETSTPTSTSKPPPSCEQQETTTTTTKESSPANG